MTPIQAIIEGIKRTGSQSAFARELGVSQALISDILRGKAGISDRMATRLGFRKSVTWVPEPPKIETTKEERAALAGKVELEVEP